MEISHDLNERLRSLRSSFDQSFAEPRAEATGALEELLLIRVGVDPYVLRLSEVGALAADRAITPVPSLNPELLGVAGLRGSIIAVFDLAALLGQPALQKPRWHALAKGSRMAFAFSAFEGQLRVDPRELSAASQRTHSALRGLLERAQGSCPLIDLPSLVVSIEARAQAGTSKETR
jgi:chemotaxis signal transduction protein